MSVYSNNIERINEDFYLNFDGGDNQLKVSTKLDFLVSTADWSFSCFAYITGSSDVNAFIFDNRIDTTSDANGITLYAKNITATSYNLSVTTGKSGGSNYNFTPTLQTNGIQHIVLSFDNASNDLSLFVNGVFAEKINVPTITAATGAFSTFGSDIDSTAFTKGGLLKLAFFNAQLTEQEVKYIYETAEIPKSKYSNLQNYYPLNQVAYKDVDTNNYFSDVVKTYNPSGTNYRAQAIGYSDGELGLDGTNGLQTLHSYYGFKTKDRHIFTGIDLKDNAGKITTNGKAVSLSLAATTFPSSFSIKWTNYHKDPITSSNTLFNSSTGSEGTTNYFIIRYTDAQLSVYYSDTVAANQKAANFAFNYPINKLVTGIIVYDDNGTSGSGFFKLFVNGVQIGSSIQRNPVVPLPSPTFFPNNYLFHNLGITAPVVPNVGINMEQSFITRALDDDEALRFSVYNTPESSVSLTDSNYLFKFNFNHTDGGTTCKDLSGTNDGTFTLLTEEIKPENTLGATSLFPKRQKGLQFDGSTYLTVAGMNQIVVDEGVTVICSVNSISETVDKDFLVMGDSDSNKVIKLSYIDTPTAIGFTSGDTASATTTVSVDKAQRNFCVYRINNSNNNNNGNYYDGAKSRVGQVNCNLSDRGDAALGRTAGTYSTYIGGDGTSYFNGIIEYVAIFRGILTDAETKELYNSGIFNNPSTALQEKYDLELFVDFNNPFNDGALKFPDLSGKYTITTNGWASLAALQGDLVNII